MATCVVTRVLLAFCLRVASENVPERLMRRKRNTMFGQHVACSATMVSVIQRDRPLEPRHHGTACGFSWGSGVLNFSL